MILSLTKKAFTQSIALIMLILLSTEIILSNCKSIKKHLNRIFDNTPLHEYCLILNYEIFIISMIGIEIYIDCAYDAITVQPEASFSTINEAKSEEGLYCYRYGNKNTKTFYSYNYDKKRSVVSSICLYDKREKDIHDNHFTRDSILKHKYPYRLEFRISISNSDRLHLDNLQGRYLTATVNI